MTKKEISELQVGDVIYQLSNDIEGKRVYMVDHSPLFVRMRIRGGLQVSHSPKASAAGWPLDMELLQSSNYTLEAGLQNAAIGKAAALLSSRSRHAKKAMEDAQAEYEAIQMTRPIDLIDQESLKAGIAKAKEALKDSGKL
jgi:hypothetical protein